MSIISNDNLEVTLDNITDTQIRCSICLEELDRNILTIKCGHKFHKKCFRKWETASKNKNNINDTNITCPLCRTTIPESNKIKKYWVILCVLLLPSLFYILYKYVIYQNLDLSSDDDDNDHNHHRHRHRHSHHNDGNEYSHTHSHDSSIIH